MFRDDGSVPLVAPGAVLSLGSDWGMTEAMQSFGKERGWGALGVRSVLTAGKEEAPDDVTSVGGEQHD